MAKVCAYSGRKAQAGRWTRHPHSGGWAHRAPTKCRRFQVNLQTVTIQTPSGKKRIKVAARMLTSRGFQAIVTGKKQLPKQPKR
jgi:ribosomal protein L28